MPEPLKLDFYSVKEVADILGFKPITVYRLTRKHKIDVIVLGKEYKYTKEAIYKFINSCTLPAEVVDKTNEK